MTMETLLVKSAPGSDPSKVMSDMIRCVTYGELYEGNIILNVA